MVPAGRVQVEPLADKCRPGAHLGGQRGIKLELGRGQHAAKAELGGRPGIPASASASASAAVMPVSRVR